MGEIILAPADAEKMDRHVLDVWWPGDYGIFPKTLSEYVENGCGEASAPATAMRCSALGWGAWDAKCEVMTEYIPSSNTGQINLIFPVQ